MKSRGIPGALVKRFPYLGNVNLFYIYYLIQLTEYSFSRIFFISTKRIPKRSHELYDLSGVETELLLLVENIPSQLPNFTFGYILFAAF